MKRREESDRSRMFRHPKLSVEELSCLVQLVGEEKIKKFRQGDQEETEFYQGLQDKLQAAIIKE